MEVAVIALACTTVINAGVALFFWFGWKDAINISAEMLVAWKKAQDDWGRLYEDLENELEKAQSEACSR